MGTSVATELLARDIEGRLGHELAGTLLFNGSIVLAAASLTISQKLLRSPLGPLVARLSNERAFRAQFARLFSDAHPLDAAEAADQWALLGAAAAPGSSTGSPTTSASGSSSPTAGTARSATGPATFELAWGMRDPVATRAVLDAVDRAPPRGPRRPGSRRSGTTRRSRIRRRSLR